MKILHLCYDDVENPWIGGGGARRVREINERLCSWGHECTVACGTYPGSEDSDEAGLRYLHLGRGASLPTSALTFIAAAWRFLLRHSRSYDVVVEDFSVFTPVLAAFLSRAPTVLQLQLYCPRRSFRRYRPLTSLLYALQQLYPRLYRNAVFLSDDLASRWVQGQQRRYLVGMGIPEHYLTHQNDHCSGGSVRVPVVDGNGSRGEVVLRTGSYLLYLGRLRFSEKGLDVLREACTPVLDALSDVRIVIAGSGRGASAVRSEYEPVMRAYPGRVVFSGHVDGARKESLLAGCRALVLPSREEGQPLSILEAAAFGRPIIASSIRELAYVGRERIGVNTVTGDSRSLASAIIDLFADSQREAELSRMAVQWARKHVWDRQARRFESVLHEVASGVRHEDTPGAPA